MIETIDVQCRGVARAVDNCDLTHRELQVLDIMAKGANNKQIAEKLVISVNTVKIHVRHILQKLYAQNRTEAVAIAAYRRIIKY